MPRKITGEMHGCRSATQLARDGRELAGCVPDVGHNGPILEMNCNSIADAETGVAEASHP